MIPNEFDVEVSGVGLFRFRKRLPKDQIWGEAEALRILGGEAPEGSGLMSYARCLADITRLMVKGPDGFQVDDLDLFDESDGLKLMRIGGALRQKEAEFRGGHRDRGEAARAGG